MKKSEKTQDTNGLDTIVNEPSKKLLEQNPVIGTPFMAVRYDEKWFLTMGKYRLSEPMKSEQEVQEDALRADWHRIMQIMQIMIDENEQIKGTRGTGKAVGEG